MAVRLAGKPCRRRHPRPTGSRSHSSNRNRNRNSRSTQHLLPAIHGRLLHRHGPPPALALAPCLHLPHGRPWPCQVVVPMLSRRHRKPVPTPVHQCLSRLGMLRHPPRPTVIMGLPIRATAMRQAAVRGDSKQQPVALHRPAVDEAIGRRHSILRPPPQPRQRMVAGMGMVRLTAGARRRQQPTRRLFLTTISKPVVQVGLPHAPVSATARWTAHAIVCVAFRKAGDGGKLVCAFSSPLVTRIPVSVLATVLECRHMHACGPIRTPRKTW